MFPETESLAQVITKVRTRIAQIHERHEAIGEQNTKAGLINPVLAALGWVLDEWDEVSFEYRSKPQDNPVDYALFLYRTPRLFVEAKALGKDLNDRRWISQVLGYATVVGVEWCVLTNGDEYRLYNAHAPVDVEEKLFRTVRISDPSQDELTVSTLLLLSKENMGEQIINVQWNAHFVDRHVKAALETLITGADPAFLRLIRKCAPKLSPSEIRDSLRRADIRISMPAVQKPVIPVPESIPPTKPIEPSPTNDDEANTVTERRAPTPLGVTISDLITAGLLQPPVNLVRDYKGTHLTATIDPNGMVTCQGEAYDSLSTSAGIARR
ncbi:MAG TPA: restriction endonuclease [Armatimonadota bacterium]|nr:restriction endonuclease [Armatimonadota bacterium]